MKIFVSELIAQWITSVHWVILFIIFISCHSVSVKQIGEEIYDLNINYPPKFIREIKFGNKSRLYLADPSSAMWFKIADLKGNVISTKSLKNLEHDFGVIDNINFLSADRILLQKKFSSKFAVIDTNLKIINEFDLNYKIFDRDSNSLHLIGLPDEFYSSHDPREIYLISVPDFEDMKRRYMNPYYDYYSIFHKIPHLCRIDDILKDSISYTLLLESYFNNINNKIFAISDLDRFQITDSIIYINSGYTDYIGCYDKKGALVNKWKVASKYTKFGYPFRYVDESFTLDSELSMDIMRQSGFIRDVFSIPNRDLFVVVVFHYDPKGSHKQRKSRDYSLIIYNSKHEKICEKKFNDGILYPPIIINGKMWMYDVKYKENGKIRYKIFDVVD